MEERGKTAMLMTLFELDSRLKVWANWCIKNNDMGLGYPRASLFSLLEETGGLAPYLMRNGQSRVLVNDIAEEIDRWLQKLSVVEPKLSKALRHFYLEQGSVKHASQYSGFSYSTLKRYCDLGRYWILGGMHSSEIGIW